MIRVHTRGDVPLGGVIVVPGQKATSKCIRCGYVRQVKQGPRAPEVQFCADCRDAAKRDGWIG